jgi:hypothetical protein
MIQDFFAWLWTWIVRWRTWLLNVLGAFLIALPDLMLFLQSPELMAVLPPGYQKWLALALLAFNVWARPRPAAIKKDE